MCVVLHKLNLNYTRPTYVLGTADKVKQENFKIDFETQKNLINGDVDHIFFEDESMIRDYQAIQKIWFIKGHPKKIPTYCKNSGIKLKGILNYETGAVYCEEHERYGVKVFLEFLKATPKQNHVCKIVMILDNAIQHGKLVQPFLVEIKE